MKTRNDYITKQLKKDVPLKDVAENLDITINVLRKYMLKEIAMKDHKSLVDAWFANMLENN